MEQDGNTDYIDLRPKQIDIYQHLRINLKN